MRVGIGLGSFIVIGTLMTFFRIPLDWKIFLILSIAYPIYHIIKNHSFNIPKIKLTKSNLTSMIVIIIVLFSHIIQTFLFIKINPIYIQTKYICMSSLPINPQKQIRKT